jgi:hypothetical protein
MRSRFALALALWLGAGSLAHAAIGAGNTMGSHNQTSAQNTNVLTTVTNDCPIGSAAYLVAAYTTIASTLSSVVDSGGNAWQTPIDNTTTTGLGIAVAYTMNTTADIPIGGTVTATFAGNTASTIVVQCLKLAAKNNMLDVHGKTATGAAASSASVASGTLASADELVATFVAGSGPMGTLGSACSGFANIGGSSQTTTPSVYGQVSRPAATPSLSCAPAWTNSITYVTDMFSFAGLWGGDIARFGAGAH